MPILGMSHFFYINLEVFMESNKLSFFSGSMLWFGAAISIAEISTGALLAPLGFWTGITAIFIGHVIGCILFYFAGLIGANSR